MVETESRTKPLIATIVFAIVMIAIGYAVVVSPVSGMEVIDMTIAGVNVAVWAVVVLFILSGIWVYQDWKSRTT